MYKILSGKGKEIHLITRCLCVLFFLRYVEYNSQRQFFFVVLKKVVLKDIRYAYKQRCVYTFSFKNIVHISTITMKLFCKPRRRTSLFVKDMFYDTANMHHYCRLSIGSKWNVLKYKKREAYHSSPFHDVRLSHCPVC